MLNNPSRTNRDKGWGEGQFPRIKSGAEAENWVDGGNVGVYSCDRSEQVFLSRP